MKSERTLYYEEQCLWENVFYNQCCIVVVVLFTSSRMKRKTNTDQSVLQIDFYNYGNIINRQLINNLQNSEK